MAYGLDTLQDRSELHVGHNDVVYEGMIVGENSRSDDMNVNPTKEKKLSNMRAAGHDRNVLLRPARRLSLEEALEFIEDDELVEVTPTQIRLRKILLNEHARKRARGRRPRWGCDAAAYTAAATISSGRCHDQLFAHDPDFPGGFDAQPDLVAADFHDGDLDAAVDDDRFVELSGEHEHDGSSLMGWFLGLYTSVHNIRHSTKIVYGCQEHSVQRCSVRR